MPFLAAGFAYYLFGALWFSPFLFQKQWDQAWGFERPPGWKPTPVYYIVPLVGCLCVAFVTFLLGHMNHAEGWRRWTGIGFHLGLLVSLPVTLTNAISPKLPRPWLYTAVVGTYHLLGATLVGAVLAWLL